MQIFRRGAQQIAAGEVDARLRRHEHRPVATVAGPATRVGAHQVVDHPDDAKVRLVQPELLAQRIGARPQVLGQSARHLHRGVVRHQGGERAKIVGLRIAAGDQPRAQRRKAARASDVELDHAAEVFAGHVRGDPCGAPARAERDGVEQARRLHAGNAAQAGQHPGVEVDRMRVFVAGQLHRGQRGFIHTAVNLDRADPAGDQETRIAQHRAGQSDLQRDQHGGHAMAAQRSEDESNLHVWLPDAW